MILIVVRDLMFSSRIINAAKELQLEYRMIRDPAKLADEVGEKLIVDLNQDGALDAASAWGKSTSKPVVGFVSHVDTPTIERAKTLGIDQILTRGQFVQVLSDVLRA